MFMILAQMLALVICDILVQVLWNVVHVKTTLHFLPTSCGFEDKSIIDLIASSPFFMLQETNFVHPHTHTCVMYNSVSRNNFNIHILETLTQNAGRRHYEMKRKDNHRKFWHIFSGRNTLLESKNTTDIIVSATSWGSDVNKTWRYWC
jgi:hypothetical protein